MRVDDTARFGACRIDAQVQGQRLARAVGAGDGRAGGVDLDERTGPQLAQAGVGGGDEEAVAQAGAQVARRAVHVAARMQRAADPAQLVAQLRFVHVATAKARLKKSAAPKLPDFKASRRPSGASAGSAWHQGTPTSICVPKGTRHKPSAWTQAPEVSPPARTRRRAPRSTSARAMQAR